jgi:hypothetical protein
MQLLETEFQESGFAFRQIDRDGDVAIYEKQWLGKVDAAIGYEVIVIQRKPAQTLFGRKYPAREVYPASARWGEQGWTLTTRERALEKAHEVSVARLNGRGRARLPFHRSGAKRGRNAGTLDNALKTA